MRPGIWSLGWEDPLEKEMATRSSTLAWKILWLEECGRLQSTGSQRVGHNWATSLSGHTVTELFFLHWEVEVGSRRLPKNNLAGRVRSGGDLGGSLASGFPGGASGKESACRCRRHKSRGVRSTGGEDPTEEGIATHSSILAWRIPWVEEPGGLQSIGSQKVRLDWSYLAHIVFRNSLAVQWVGHHASTADPCLRNKDRQSCMVLSGKKKRAGGSVLCIRLETVLTDG